MHVDNRKLSAIFKLVIVALVIYAVVAGFTGSSGPSPLRYFTFQSNIVVGAVAFYLALGRLRAFPERFRLDSYLRGLTIFAISITGIVFHVLLASELDHISFTNQVLHTVVPVAFVLDWLVFGPKGSYRYRDILIWMIFPVVYLVATLIVARFDGFYPYPFMDAGTFGYGTVALNVGLLVVAFTFLGGIYVNVDRLMSLSKRRASAA